MFLAASGLLISGCDPSQRRASAMLMDLPYNYMIKVSTLLPEYTGIVCLRGPYATEMPEKYTVNPPMKEKFIGEGLFGLSFRNGNEVESVTFNLPRNFVIVNSERGDAKRLALPNSIKATNCSSAKTAFVSKIKRRDKSYFLLSNKLS
jgi:hypothetical protein